MPCCDLGRGHTGTAARLCQAAYALAELLPSPPRRALDPCSGWLRATPDSPSSVLEQSDPIWEPGGRAALCSPISVLGGFLGGSGKLMPDAPSLPPWVSEHGGDAGCAGPVHSGSIRLHHNEQKGPAGVWVRAGGRCEARPPPAPHHRSSSRHRWQLSARLSPRCRPALPAGRGQAAWPPATQRPTAAHPTGSSCAPSTSLPPP